MTKDQFTDLVGNRLNVASFHVACTRLAELRNSLHRTINATWPDMADRDYWKATIDRYVLDTIANS